jgi:glycerophosphoryl diester phosphodiesterase
MSASVARRAVVIGILATLLELLSPLPTFASEPASAAVVPTWATLPRGSSIAHRGGPCCAPENTMEAFRKAYAAGVPAIEFDVRVLGDGTQVVIHDATVDRTTGATGAVTSFTLARWRALGLPTYADVLREFGNRMVLLVEPKVDGGVLRVMDGLRAYGVAKSSVVINSFIRDDLVRAEARGYATMWLTGTVAQAAAGHAEWFAPRQDTLTKAMVADAHRRGMRVATWTVQTSAQETAARAKGVDALITDRPRELVA